MEKKKKNQLMIYMSCKYFNSKVYRNEQHVIKHTQDWVEQEVNYMWAESVQLNKAQVDNKRWFQDQVAQAHRNQQNEGF